MKIQDIKESGTLHIHDKSTSPREILEKIAASRENDDAFFVVDISDVIQKHKQWKKLLPNVAPFYAVKCNDTNVILEVLATLGTGFDCASKGEIEKVLDLGVHPDRIIYANPCKTKSHIKFAASVGVRRMTFDNEAELHKVKANHPDAELVLRIRADALECQCPMMGIKFGVEPDKGRDLLKKARDLGLNVIGISFHVGSGCSDLTAFPRAIHEAKQLFEYSSSLGFKFHLLDLGGGYPGTNNTSVRFPEIAKSISLALKLHFPVGCGVRVIAEPGRYYVASCMTLATNVIAKREVGMIQGKSFMYYINDGIYGSFNCLVYDQATVNPKPLMTNGKRKLVDCSIWGPTCDSADKVLPSASLPELEVGEWLVFENMGAYTCVAGSNFNGFSTPDLYFVVNMSSWFGLKKKVNRYCKNYALAGRSSCKVLSSHGEELEDVGLAATLETISRLFQDNVLISTSA